VALFGLGFFCLSQVTNLAMFYAASLILALGTSLATQMVPAAMVARWFKKGIGKASGILAMGHGIGGILIPLLVMLIDTYGWRYALIVLAIVIWVVGIPLAFVFRDRPEDYGLLPDGESIADKKISDSAGSVDFSTGFQEALKMRAFWSIGIATLFQVSIMSAGTVHLMPYLVSLGIERSNAGLVAMVVPLVSLAVRIPYGVLADKFRKNYVIAIVIGLLSVSMFIFWSIDGSSFGLVLLGAIALGLGIGGLASLRPPIIREYFGTKNFGAIYGLSGVFATVGMVTAPPLAGWIYDTSGIYGQAWLILGILAMVGVIIMLTLPPATRRLPLSGE